MPPAPAKAPARRGVRCFLIAALVLMSGALFSGCDPGGGAAGSSPGAAYPTKALNLICAWAPGGGTDLLSRFVADQLQSRLGQPVIVVNKTGGSGAIGHSAGALAKPDGYTLTMGTFELSTMHWMGIADLTWKNYEPVFQFNADAAAILVQSSAPWNSLTDLLDYARANPGKLKMSGTAIGGAWDLARCGLLLAAGMKVDSILWIPKQGAAPSIVDLLGGHIDAVACSVPEAASQIEAGQLKVLAVMSTERLPNFPNLKTAREQGVAWDAVGWRGLLAPKGTPSAVVDRLASECKGILESELFKKFMSTHGFAIVARDPAAFALFLEQQDAQWRQVIESAGYAKR